MSLSVCVVLVLMGLTCVLLYLGAVRIERRWMRQHPPDDWDGCREYKDTDNE